MDVIRLSNVTKSYGKHTAVSNLSLEVPAGSLYGFIGPNGSGKTTTIRMILRIIHQDTGQVEVLGQSSGGAANDAVGYLPEERGLYKKLSVSRMLHYYAALKGMGRKEAQQSIDGWLKRFDLSEWASKKIETLSKGMSQKVQFMASIIAAPKLLILDEPFSGLDPVNAEVIRSAIRELQQNGTTVIFSTHDMYVAEKMCDFVFMIYQGHKVLDGTLDQIKANYGADTVRLRWNGDREELPLMPEVSRVVDMGAYQELVLHGDAQSLLRRLTDRGHVQLFEVTQPSLHEIFIRIASPDEDEISSDVSFSERTHA